jgi:hypothetical protein
MKSGSRSAWRAIGSRRNALQESDAKLGCDCGVFGAAARPQEGRALRRAGQSFAGRIVDRGFATMRRLHPSFGWRIGLESDDGG